jgi:hypothetical protein
LGSDYRAGLGALRVEEGHGYRLSAEPLRADRADPEGRHPQSFGRLAAAEVRFARAAGEHEPEHDGERPEESRDQESNAHLGKSADEDRDGGA